MPIGKGDMLGFGKNEPPEGNSIKEMADDQAEAMKRLGIGKSSVLGISVKLHKGPR